MGHICPWWYAYTFDHRGRRLFHKAEVMFADYVKEGMTVLDVGCGMGFFSIGMAGLVGDAGKVIAVDVQQEMLDVMLKRASNVGLENRILPRLCRPDNLSIREEVDFALCFWMVHEVPNKLRFFSQIRSSLKRSAKFLVVEPKLHVSLRSFLGMVDVAKSSGFSVCGSPGVRLSLTALLKAGV